MNHIFCYPPFNFSFDFLNQIKIETNLSNKMDLLVIS